MITAKNQQPAVFSRQGNKKPLRQGKTQGYISTGRLDEPSPSAMNWKADGVDHINISRQASTDLGFALNNSSPLDFYHSVFGYFGSMETFWHYIQSKERDDRIRGMKGPVLQNFVSMLTWNTVVNFRAIIMDSNYQRIKEYDALQDELRNSTLPFDCYTVNAAGIRIRPTFFKWLTFGFEEIRKALKENREPDFSILLDVPKSGIYDFVVPDQDKSRVDAGRSQRRSRRPYVKR